MSIFLIFFLSSGVQDEYISVLLSNFWSRPFLQQLPMNYYIKLKDENRLDEYTIDEIIIISENLILLILFNEHYYRQEKF